MWWCAVLVLGFTTGALLFVYACAYHWSLLHESPLAPREAPLVGSRHFSATRTCRLAQWAHEIWASHSEYALAKFEGH